METDTTMSEALAEKAIALLSIKTVAEEIVDAVWDDCTEKDHITPFAMKLNPRRGVAIVQGIFSTALSVLYDYMREEKIYDNMWHYRHFIALALADRFEAMVQTVEPTNDPRARAMGLDLAYMNATNLMGRVMKYAVESTFNDIKHNK